MDFLCAAHRAPFEQTCSRIGDATDCTSGGMCRMHVRSVIGHATLDLLTTTNSGAQPLGLDASTSAGHRRCHCTEGIVCRPSLPKKPGEEIMRRLRKAIEFCPPE